MGDLRKVRADHDLHRRLRIYQAPKVLVVDEFGIWSYVSNPATAFFTLVSARYDLGSIILTFNKSSTNGVNCWEAPSSPRQSWTGCCNTAACPTSWRELHAQAEPQTGLFSSHQLLNNTPEGLNDNGSD